MGLQDRYYPLSIDLSVVSPPTKSEIFWRKIPLLGWAIASAMATRRLRPVAEHVERQLRECARFPTEAWGPQPTRLRVARLLSSAIRDEIGWVNDHFIPADPVEVVFWAYYDGLAYVSLTQEIEDTFNIRFDDEDFRQLSRRTLGDLVDHLVKHGSGELGVDERKAR